MSFMDKIIPATPEAIFEHIDERRNHLTDTQIAAIIGVNKQIFANWKIGRFMPNGASLAKLGLEPCFRVIDDSLFVDKSKAVVTLEASELRRRKVTLLKELETIEQQLDTLTAKSAAVKKKKVKPKK